MEKSADYDHFIQHAQEMFPGAAINITYTPDEIIYLDVDGHRYTFEVTRDDDTYTFYDGSTSFAIPLFLDPT